MNLLSKMKLAHRFGLAIGIFVLGFALYGGVSFFELQKLKVNGPIYKKIVQGKDLIADILPPPEYIIESYLVVMQLGAAENSQDRDKLIARLNVLQKEYEDRHNFWMKESLDALSADLLLKQSYVPAMAFYAASTAELIPAVQKQDSEAIGKAMKKLGTLYQEHRQAIDKLVEHASANNLKQEVLAVEEIRYGTAIMLAILVCSVAGGIFVAWLVLRNLLRQLRAEPDHAAKVARSIADGRLTMPIHVRPGDEHSLIAAMQSMQNVLKTIVGDISRTVHQVNTGSAQIASGNADLSSRTEQQASSLEETASSMEELTSTVKQNADNARQANQLAATASGVAVKGGDVVRQVVTTMEGITESSKKIADIISVIDGIAFQTNILALNAAVEAARAGEQGRGFAVVATEVRNLAQRSAAAAKEIKELISDSVEKVESGSALVGQAGTTMDEIVESVKRVTDIMAEITAASQEQSAGIEQVNQAIGQMDQVTQQNAALVEEAAAAAESLQEQAGKLAQAVSVFRLDGMQDALVSAQAMPVRTVPIGIPPATATASGTPAIARPAKRQLPTKGGGAVKALAQADAEWEEF